MPSNRQELGALKRMLSETDLILSTSELPENSTTRCRELLKAAIACTDDLLKQEKLPAAAILGQRGGSQTARRGSEYFLWIAAKRQVRAGGRLRKETNKLRALYNDRSEILSDA
jgi:hypothetical protein